MATAPTYSPHLVIEGAVAAKLTNDRMTRLLSYAGRNLLSLKVCGAPSIFSGFSLTGDARGLLHKDCFPKLRTVILNQCPGITAGCVGHVLRSIGVDNRVKASRLDRLSLAGCDVDKLGLAALDTFVRHDRDVSLPFSKGHFDLWPCVHCPNVIQDGLHCVDCDSVACIAHSVDGIGKKVCSFCDAYVCLADACGADEEDYEDDNVNEHSTSCDDCGIRICRLCSFASEHAHTCTGSDDKAGCFKTLCEECDKRKDFTFVSCDGCYGFWCDDCLPRQDTHMCSGSDDKQGCSLTFCPDCSMTDAAHTFTYCLGECNGCWCDNCLPERLPMCTGSDDKKGCFTALCADCFEKRQHFFTGCAVCDGLWCDDCLPADTLKCTGYDGADACFISICPSCNDSKMGERHIIRCNTCDTTQCNDCAVKNNKSICVVCNT